MRSEKTSERLARRPGRGRPTLQEEQRARLAVALPEGGTIEMLFDQPHEYPEWLEPLPLPEKIQALHQYAKDATDRAKILQEDPDFKAAAASFWDDDLPPEDVVERCEVMLTAIDRAIDALTHHAAQLTALRAQIETTLVNAKRRAADALRAPYEGTAWAELQKKLVDNGIVAEDVRRMSAERVASIAAIIKGAPLPPVEGENGLAAEEENGEEAAGSEPAEGPENTDGEQASLTESGADAPQKLQTIKNRWGELDVASIGYEAEIATASTEADFEALEMPLPKCDDVMGLAVENTPYFVWAKYAIELNRRDLFMRVAGNFAKRMNLKLTDMQQRVWALFLLEMKKKGQKSIGANGWLDGVVIPVEEGSRKVIRLRAIDRSEEGLKEAWKPTPGQQ